MPCKEEEDEVKVSLDKKIQAVSLTDGMFGVSGTKKTRGREIFFSLCL